jgi:hypothetical protein
MNDPKQSGLSLPVISLLKGVVYRDQDEALWQAILNQQAALQDYVTVLGLQLVLDPAEGFAWLRGRELAGDEVPLPRLMARRQLPFLPSLLLALLCRKLVEQDSSGDSGRLVLSRDDLVDLARVYLPANGNEAKTSDQILAALGRLEELGFVRRLKADERHWEIRRIVKTFVDAQWLAEFDARLAEYRQLAGAGEAQ